MEPERRGPSVFAKWLPERAEDLGWIGELLPQSWVGWAVWIVTIALPTLYVVSKCLDVALKWQRMRHNRRREDREEERHQECQQRSSEERRENRDRRFHVALATLKNRGQYGDELAAAACGRAVRVLVELAEEDEEGFEGQVRRLISDLLKEPRTRARLRAGVLPGAEQRTRAYWKGGKGGLNVATGREDIEQETFEAELIRAAEELGIQREATPKERDGGSSNG